MAEDRETPFIILSAHYADALDTMTAIERQAATILAHGGAEHLRTIVDQFIAMCGETRDAAREANEPDFAEWFEELMRKAEAIREAIPVY